MVDESFPQQRPEQLLGELEAAVMHVIWERGEVTVRTVHAALQPTRQLAYTTVMTVMSRLAQKGLLSTRKQGKIYFYQATVSPEAFVVQRAQRAVQDVLDSFGDIAIAHFLRAINDLDPERLAALRALGEQEPRDET